MVHLVGLGGAGCNVLEFALKKDFKARYTFITSPFRKHLPQYVNFIEYCSPKNYWMVDTWFNKNIELPKEMIELFNESNVIYVVGLGGYTGTLLLKAILNCFSGETNTTEVNINNDIQHSNVTFPQYIVSLPFLLEGSQRIKCSKDFAKNYLNELNMDAYDLDTIPGIQGDISLKEAFLKADEYAFNKIQLLADK